MKVFLVFCGGDGPKSNAIAGKNEGRVGLLGSEQSQRCPADEAPATRRCNGVDARLCIGYADSSASYFFARRGQSRDSDTRIHVTEIWKSGSEPKETHTVGHAGMNIYNLSGGKLSQARY